MGNQEGFDDIKRVIRIRKSEKDRQYNSKEKKENLILSDPNSAHTTWKMKIFSTVVEDLKYSVLPYERPWKYLPFGSFRNHPRVIFIVSYCSIFSLSYNILLTFVSLGLYRLVIVLSLSFYEARLLFDYLFGIFILFWSQLTL